MRISDWSSDVCSSDLEGDVHVVGVAQGVEDLRRDEVAVANVSRRRQVDAQRDVRGRGGAAREVRDVHGFHACEVAVARRRRAIAQVVDWEVMSCRVSPKGYCEGKRFTVRVLIGEK